MLTQGKDSMTDTCYLTYLTSCFRTILREVGQEWVAPAHFNNHGNNAINKMKLWKMFKGSTTRVIRQLIV